MTPQIITPQGLVLPRPLTLLLLIPYNRAGGITSAIVTPSSVWDFLWNGFMFKINGALMTESMIEDIALVMNLGGNKDSRASTIMSLEDSFEVARRFAMKRSSIMRGDDFDFGDYSIRDLDAIQKTFKTRHTPCCSCK